jgi:hypothetical protein
VGTPAASVINRSHEYLTNARQRTR